VSGVLIEVAGGVADVRLNRPDKLNAIDEAILTGLVEVGRQIADDRSVRAVVLSGAGRAFCSGVDTATLGNMASGDLTADDVRAANASRSPSVGVNRAQEATWIWQEIPQPVIAAVHGAAFGGGLNLALGADIRLVHPEARLAFVEATWGLVPDMSATQSLRHLVRLDRAKELVLTGRKVSGAEAAEIGLATRTTMDPRKDALDLATTIARNSSDAMRAVKTLLNRSRHLGLAEGLALEFEQSGSLMGTSNQIEAVMSRLEGRPAVYGD